jgi:Penicillin binding protein transpeptidase domain
MRVAARDVVAEAHTVVGARNMTLDGRPFVLAGKSGTAEFGVRDAQGRLPYHTWFVGFVPKALTVAPGSAGQVAARADALVKKTDSQLAVVGFAYASNSFGNVGTEIVKYFLQMYYGLDDDYRWPRAYEKTNFYSVP